MAAAGIFFLCGYLVGRRAAAAVPRSTPRRSPSGFAELSRGLSLAIEPDEILRLLAESAQAQMSANAAIVLRVTVEGRVEPVACTGLDRLEPFHAELEDFGDDLCRRVLAATYHRFEHVHAVPLVSGRDLFGVLVLLFDTPLTAAARDAIDANPLVDLAAVALERVREYAALAQAHRHVQTANEVLHRTERLRALGEMAAGVSHDLKNILGPLPFQIQLLQRAGHDERTVPSVVRSLERIYRRGLDTVERLRAFSRQTSEDVASQAVDLNAVVAEASELCRHRTRTPGQSVDVRLNLGAPPPVVAPASELVAALVNLIANAIDALPSSGGVVTLETGVGRRRGEAYVVVQDTGAGMPGDVRERIFQPFFTTKGQQGTGLGLSMVQALVERMGGSIDVRSAPGEGTTFTLHLAGVTARADAAIG